MHLPTLSTILVEERSPGVVLATLNRPDRLNALTEQMFEDLIELGASLRKAEGLRVLVVTGAGRGFCAGFDLKGDRPPADLNVTGMVHRQDLATEAAVALRSLPVPVIAAVNGAAVGGGLALALAADYRFGSPQARFSCAFVRVGLSAGDMGVSWLLPRLIGWGRASEFLYTSRFMDAEEAAAVGLVNRVIPAEDLVEEALRSAEQIAEHTAGAIRASKQVVQLNQEISSFAAALELEGRGQIMLSFDNEMHQANAKLKGSI